MKHMKRLRNICCRCFRPASGFTMVELLVVILIIGILVSLVLPQYDKMILQSYGANGFQMLEAVAQAQEAYYEEHGYYANDPKRLAIAFPGAKISGPQITAPGEWQITLHYSNGVGTSCAIIFSKIPGATLFLYYDRSPNATLRGDRRCYANTGKPRSVRFCQAVSGHDKKDSTNGFNAQGEETVIYKVPYD